MSYSFSVLQPTKDAAFEQASIEFHNVVKAQPVHEADIPAASDALESLLNVLGDFPDMDVSVSVTGSCWGTEQGLRQTSLSINVGYTQRAP